MTKYKVIAATRIDQLIFEVNEAIGEGWHPIGGVAVTTFNLYMQAIIIEL